MAIAPKWAQELIITVAIDYGRDKLPDVTWRRRHQPARHDSRHGYERQAGTQSSGRAWGPVMPDRIGSYATPRWDWAAGRIVVTAGTDRMDQRLVLLHELAHWLSPPKEHHGSEWWALACQLYRRYKVPIRFAERRERRKVLKA